MLLKGSDIRRASRRTVLLKGSDIKRASRRTVLLIGGYTGAIQLPLRQLHSEKSIIGPILTHYWIRMISSLVGNMGNSIGSMI